MGVYVCILILISVGVYSSQMSNKILLKKKRINFSLTLNWFVFSYFNGTSTFMSHLMPKPSL